MIFANLEKLILARPDSRRHHGVSAPIRRRTRSTLASASTATKPAIRRCRPRCGTPSARCSTGRSPRPTSGRWATWSSTSGSSELALGPLAAGLTERTTTIQTVGGCGALRVGAELVRASLPDARRPRQRSDLGQSRAAARQLGSARLSAIRTTSPRIAASRSTRMLGHVGRLPSGSIVLLHACCHNPTGADLDAGQWRRARRVSSSVAGSCRSSISPTRGSATTSRPTSHGLRLLATRVPQLLLAISCSKNFGLYRERTGALAVVAENATAAAAIATHQARTARRMYSMPPDHGAAIVARAARRSGAARGVGVGGRGDGFAHEVVACAARGASCRAAAGPRFRLGHAPSRHVLAARPRRRPPSRELRSTHHIYMPSDGRINVAGMSDTNVDRVADGIVAVMG